MRASPFFKTVIVSVLVLMVFSALPGHAKKAAKKKFEVIAVDRFEVKPGVDFPPDYRFMIDEELNKKLAGIKGVQGVLREGEALPQGKTVLRITGVITKFKKGSEAKRVLVGFGAGVTIIYVHFKCYDAATQELLFERDIDGRVFASAKSEEATSDLAYEITESVQAKFY